ncbi:hypothetical protein [Pseudorhodoplanes sp.]|uniref:hypothetical protein n=1 Tax=Pseudorhodoplanes sp. TaxID=1934341 RepID=UPI00391BBF8F
MSRLKFVSVCAVAAATLNGVVAAHAKSCSGLNGQPLNSGELYALYFSRSERSGKPVLKSAFLYPGVLQATSLEFDEKVRLIYVINPPAPGAARNFAGALAVRLVSTGTDGSQRAQPPRHVMLSRDAVRTRGRVRSGFTGSVDALRYYNYHRPSTLLASDSLLETTFHTSYTYRRGEERSTIGTRARRTAFHFPEMRSPEPAEGTRAWVFRWFGGGALAAGTESRFQSHIKYYPAATEGYCVTIIPYLEAGDNGSLTVTISDLDYPDGVIAGARTWNIRWVAPNRTATR